MRPLFALLQHILIANLASTCRGQFGVQNDRSVLGINNEYSGVCYTYVSVYPVLADIPDYITITKPYRGSVTALYTVPPQGDEPGIVIVEQPGGSSAPENVVIPATDDRSYVIIIRPYTGTQPITAPITQVVPPTDGRPGQIIIETPETFGLDATPGVLQPVTLEPQDTTGYVTVLQPISNTLASLQLVTITPTGTNRGSVIINIPASSLNGVSPQGITLDPTSEGDYVTVIEPAGVSFTGTVPIRITVAPSGDRPGTVIIQTPVPRTLRPVSLETLGSNALSSLGLLDGQTITLQPTDATGYVTVIEPAEGSVTPTAPIRTTIPPTGTKPGTVLIQTPPGGNNGRPGGPQITDAAGSTILPTRTQPEGVLSYTTITRGVPNGLGGSGNGSGDGSNDGDNSGKDGADGDDDYGFGGVQGRPGQGQGDDEGPRQTITIPPEGGNPGTVLVLTPNSQDTLQTDDDSDDLPAGTRPTDGSSTGGQGGADSGSEGGSSSDDSDVEDGSGSDSSNGSSSPGSGSGSGTNSGNTSGRPSQGSSSSEGGSNDVDGKETGSGGVQSNGSGSQGGEDDGDTASGDGNTGSGSGSTSGNGGRPGSDEDDGSDSSGSGISQGGDQGSGQGGNGSSTRSASASQGSGSASGSSSGNGDESLNGGTQGGGSGSQGEDIGDDDPSVSSSGRGSSTSRRSTSTQSAVVTTRPATYTVTSSNTVITITANTVETLSNDRSSSTGRPTSMQRSSVDAQVEGLGGGSEGPAGSTTFARPANSRSTSSSKATTSAAGSDDDGDTDATTVLENAPPEASPAPGPTDAEDASSESTFSGSVDTAVRPGGSDVSTTTRSSTTTTRPSTRSSSGFDGEPDETEFPSTTKSSTAPERSSSSSSSTRPGQGSSSSESISSRTSTTTSSTGSLKAQPEGLGTNFDDVEESTTSRTAQRSSSVTTSTALGSSTAKSGETTSPAVNPRPGVETSSQRSATTSSLSSSMKSSSASQATTRPSTARSGEDVVDTSTGSQSVTESDRVPPADGESSTTPSTTSTNTSNSASNKSEGSATSAGPSSNSSQTRSQATGTNDPATNNENDTESSSSEAGLTGQPAGGPGRSTTIEDDDAEPSTVLSNGAPIVAEPSETTTSIGPDGRESLNASDDGASGTVPSNIETGKASESDAAEATSTKLDEDDEGENETANESGVAASQGPDVEGSDRTLTNGPTNSIASGPNAYSSAPDEGVSETDSVGAGVTSTGAEGGPTGSGAGDDGEEDESSTTGEDDARVSTTDNPVSVTGSSTDDERQITTNVSGEVPAASITADNSESTEDSDGIQATVTFFRAGRGQFRTTLYIPPQSSNEPWSVIIETPVSETQPEAATARGDEDVLATEPAITGTANITLFRAGSGSTRRTFYVAPATADKPGTIIIEIPEGITPTASVTTVPSASDEDDEGLASETASDSVSVRANITVYTSGTGSVRTTIYYSPTASGEPGIVVVETLVSGVDAEETADGVNPSQTGSLEGSIRSNETVYSSGTASTERTLYIPPTASGEPGIIIIETPVPDASAAVTTGSTGDGDRDPAATDTRSGTTIFTDGTGTVATTIYIPPASSGGPGTFIVETTASDADEEPTFEDANESTGSEALTTPAPSDILYPGVDGNLTLYRSGASSTRRTIFIPPTASDDKWTVVIETPASGTELEQTGTAATVPGFQTTEPAVTGTANFTLFRAGPAATRRTLYVAPKTSGAPGTIVIETPTPKSSSPGLTANPDALTTGDAISASSATTVVVEGTGTKGTTYYVPPSRTGDPGTLYIETPGSGDETAASDDASATEAGSSSGGTNTTIFSAGTASILQTIYYPPATSGGQGTVVVETPVSESGAETERSGETTDTLQPSGLLPNVTVSNGIAGSVTRTVYIHPTASGEAGTIVIEFPTTGADDSDDSDTATESQSGASEISAGTTVTITTGGSVSVAQTRYVPPTASGEAGTLIIETPTDGPVATALTEDDGDDEVISAATTVTSFRGGPASITRTTYIPPTASGEAGTLIVETPTEGSEASPATDEDAEATGDPESPNESDDDVISATITTTIFSAGPASITRTFYDPPASSGEPGTLIIVTPSGNVGASSTSNDASTESDRVSGPASATDEDADSPTSADSSIDSEEDIVSATTTTTEFRGGPASVTMTTYIAPTASDEPGTLIIVTPTEGSGASATDDEDVDESGDSSETDSITDTDEIEATTTFTSFRGGSDSTTETVYNPPTASDEAGTLIIETPTSDPDGGDVPSGVTGTEAGTPTPLIASGGNVTIYSGGPASSTTTRYIPATISGEQGTVVIETPTSGPQATGIGNVTVITGGPAPVTKTRYVPATVTGEPGTIVIETPTFEGNDPTYVTRYTGGPGTAPTTIYLTPDEPGDSTTMIIQTPTQGITEGRTVTEDDKGTTLPITSSDTAMFSSAGNVTITSGGFGTATRTIYIPPTASGESGTVIVEYPTGDGDGDNESDDDASSTGATGDGDATTFDATTIAPTQSGGNSTIIQGGPASVATTIYITPAASGEGGTIIIETPTGDNGETDVYVTRTITDAPSATDQPGNTTIYTNAPGTATETFYFPPDEPGEVGTIIVVSPSRANATTIYSGGPVTSPRTLYISATVSGELDTVLVETPTTDVEAETSEVERGRTNTTIFTGGSGTATRTVVISATVSGEPDTFRIETPTGASEETESGVSESTAAEDSVATTLTRGGSASVATTITVPGVSGEPGTAYVETPTTSSDDSASETDDGEVDATTITRGGPASAATTVTVAGVSGGPDTVYVETPTTSADGSASETGDDEPGVITITRGGPASVSTTITVTGTSGEPDVVYIEIPTVSNSESSSKTSEGIQVTTITRGGPASVTTTITVTGASGEPDVVYVETPTASDRIGASETDDVVEATTITRGGPAAVATTTTISGVYGQPDTILIETPTASDDDKEPSQTGEGEVEATTITRGGPVPVVTTITIPGVSGQPGTVFVETPTSAASEREVSTTEESQVEATTITRGGSVSAATTITIPGVSGQPDTIVAETPTEPSDNSSETDGVKIEYTTIVRGGSVTAATTATIAGVSGGPDTVFIETPTESATNEEATKTGDDDVEATTITTGGPVSAATTVTLPGVSGAPDTVLVQTPTRPGDVDEPSATGEGEDNDDSVATTITRGGTVTADTTITIPGESDEPDTIVVETPTNGSEDDETVADTTTGVIVSPQDRPNTTIYAGGPVSVPQTRYVSATVSGEPDTIFIETPTTSSGEARETGTLINNDIEYTTLFTAGSGTASRTITLAPDSSNEVGTVIVETPTNSGEDGEEQRTTDVGPTATATGDAEEIEYTTRFTGWSGTTTRAITLQPDSPDEFGTVIVETPTGSATDVDRETATDTDSTTTATDGAGEVEYTTRFSGWSGTITRTTTLDPDSPDELGTVIVETPIGSLEDEEENTASDGASSATVTGDADNIEYTTVFTVGSVTASRTTTLQPGSSGDLGTIIIEVPTDSPGDTDDEVQYTTVYTAGLASIPRTTTISPGSSGGLGTVVIETPTATSGDEEEIEYTTIFTAGSVTASRTTTLPPGTSGGLGTVVIETPSRAADDDDEASTDRATASEIRYTTVFTDGSGTAFVTTTLAPGASEDLGTVIIETPTSLAGDDGEVDPTDGVTATISGSVIVNERYPNTTFYTGGSGSVTRTRYYPPASEATDAQGTVVIETPTTGPDPYNVTHTVGGPASVTTTIYIPPTAAGEPGEVIIQTPTSGVEGSEAAEASATVTKTETLDGRNTTIYTGGPGSVETTIYYPPATDDPDEVGTVIVQTPTVGFSSGSDRETASETSTESIASTEAPIIQNLTLTVAGPAGVTTTLYIPPVGSGEPGTIVVQVPTTVLEETSSSVIQNVTRTVGGPASVETTIYIPPSGPGEPGTVIIETPTTAPSTSTTAPPAGASTTSTPIVPTTNTTVYVDAPATATAETTLYVPPTAIGEPGTVIVQTLVATPGTSSGSMMSMSLETPVLTTLSSSSSTSDAAVTPASTSISTSVASSTSTSSSSPAAVVSSTISSPAASAAPTSTSSSAVVVPLSSSSSSSSSSTPSTSTSPISSTSSSSSSVIPAVAASSAGPAPTGMPAFNCDGYGYIISSLLAPSLTRVNLLTGARNTIATGIGPGLGIQGIGFNPYDNYIYGFATKGLLTQLVLGVVLSKPQSQLIRIASNGNWELLPLILETQTISMGDIDNQGRLFVSESGKAWWSIDLKKGSSTFGKIIKQGTSKADLLSGVGDWSYVPGGGDYLYSVQASALESGLLQTNIVRWSTSTNTWSSFKSYPGILLTALNLVWGATIAAPNNVLFAQENVLGQTWRFQLDGTADPQPIAGGTILNLNGDGAKCASGAVV